MASEKKIVVAFEQISFKRTAAGHASGSFTFELVVDGKPLSAVVAELPRPTLTPLEGGDGGAAPAAKAAGAKPLVIVPGVSGPTGADQEAYSCVVDVSKKKQLLVEVRCTPTDAGSKGQLDNLNVVLHRFRDTHYRHDNRHFILDWHVLLVTGIGRHGPQIVTACRGHLGSLTCTTLSGATGPVRFEIHPVRPTPRWGKGLPKRPKFPAGSAPAWERTKGTAITANSPINAIPNPAVIPILGDGDRTIEKVARIEVTYYRPGSLKLQPGDPDLEWTAEPKHAVGFLASSGLGCFVYGKKGGEGMVLLKLYYKKRLAATYRALVAPILNLPCRFNIIHGPTPADSPRSTAADIVNHVKVANVLLRQIGAQVVFDPDTGFYRSGARASGPHAMSFHRGIFNFAGERKRPRGETRNITDANSEVPAKLNYRPGVANVGYIHSFRGTTWGLTVCWAGNRRWAAGPVVDGGTPSSSWVKPSGVPPDGAARSQQMKIDAAHEPERGLWAVLVSNACGDPKSVAGQRSYGFVLAHELGHVMGLGHRGKAESPPDTWDDSVKHPPVENLMYRYSVPNTAEDLDILQALAARGSAVFPP